MVGVFRCQRVHWAPCSSGIVQYLLLWILLVLTACHQPKNEQSAITAPLPERFVGFSIFGPDWPQEKKFADQAERVQYLEEQGYLVAQHTSRLYGNMVRIPISLWGVLGRDLLAEVPSEFAMKPVYQLDDTVITVALDRLYNGLGESQAAMEKWQNPREETLLWKFWDAFFSGIQKYNRELESTPLGQYHSVFVDLVLIERPPALILETSAGGVGTSINDSLSTNGLWGSYRQLHLTFIRKLIQRYGKGYVHNGVHAFLPIVAAVELFNEPDYVWIPDEAKIERALDANVYPCDKYLTQLHLLQIPENDLPGKGCVRRYGLYQEQDLGFTPAPTALRDFRWGAKFNKYVASFADLHHHASHAANDEIKRGGAAVRVISSAVTHVNLDWFRRMFQADAETFNYVNAVAIHPYHWPRHDIHDMRFVGSPFEKDWTMMSPREFASQYCKRFDFLTILASLVAKSSSERSYGLAGRSIWVTEFGVPTKKIGRDNSEEILRRYPLAIYDRASPAPEGIATIVWEDKWEAFFEQVSVEFLKQNHVEAFLVYTLRESAENETNDNNHSNFALYRSDWSSRVAPEVLSRLADFFLRFRDG